ncbi:bidirectional sugar transporter SWEET4 [Striga asiatica]|uniref:Bidirectional sugar transporter SWEET4 n=1 Tax=Striga asiatica TaxID=4170 RepID=A0A5A7PPF7_STRAF|nr:bidirectional sugar transporter SWEET4 [Striga asiatica]
MATLANCGLWALYGMPMVHPHSTLVVTINGLGFFIEITFLTLFFIFSDLKKRLRVVIIMVAICVCLAVLALLVLILAGTTQLRSTVVGSIAMAANILMYASPLSVMKLVITTRSVEYMPFLLSLFTLLNAICWLSYALIQFDLFLMIPNGMGTFFGLAQLILYAVFYKSSKQIIASKRAQTQVGLTEIRPDSNS